MRTWSLFLIVGLVFFVLAMGSAAREERNVPIIVILWACTAALVVSGIVLKVREKRKNEEYTVDRNFGPTSRCW